MTIAVAEIKDEKVLAEVKKITA